MTDPVEPTPKPEEGTPPAPPADGGTPPAPTPETKPEEGKKEGEGAPKPEDGKEKKEETPKPVVPETYDLKAPEGTTLHDADMGEFTGVAKELGLTNEQAQKGLDLFAKVQAAQTARNAEAWLQASKADKEFGGAQFDGNVALAQQAYAKFATPELRTFLDSTGLGNHPELLRMFVKIGKASSEDNPGNPKDGEGPRPLANRLFPDMK